MKKKKVIVITDGDEMARQAVEIASKQIGCRCISLSAGNPTLLTGSEIREQVMKAPCEPIVVMFDDNGNKNKGYGERALNSLSSFSDIQLIGAIAVASDSHEQYGIEVDFSINRYCEKVECGIDKMGFNTTDNKVFGDTVKVLDELNIPVIVGIGDPGKMEDYDHPLKGAPVTTKALQEIMKVTQD